MLCSLVSNVVSMLYNYQQRGQSLDNFAWGESYAIQRGIFSSRIFSSSLRDIDHLHGVYDSGEWRNRFIFATFAVICHRVG
jgi:hypothetical protein